MTALARIRLSVCELLESLPPDDAAAMLRSIVDEIVAEAPSDEDEPPADALAEVEPRPGPRLTERHAPDLRVVGAPQRSTLAESRFQSLFAQPAPVKCAILEYLATMSEPVPFRQILRHLHLMRVTADDASVSQSLREMRKRLLVERTGTHAHYAWTLLPLATGDAPSAQTQQPDSPAQTQSTVGR